MLVLYTDDTMMTGPNENEIQSTINDISKLYEITINDQVTDFFCVNIDVTPEGEVHLTQQLLIKSILKDLGLDDDSKGRRTPALSTKNLYTHDESPPMNENWSYRMIIGKLNYLEKSTRPDISYAVHQCACFASDPRVEHAKAVKAIGQYLKSTLNKGKIFKPNNEGIVCYSDADFAGNWRINDAETNTTTARSRTG
jgi:hypothetical protein